MEQDYLLAIVAAQRAAFDPPKFECLSSFVKLQDAAQSTWPSFDAWYRATRTNRHVWNPSVLPSVAGEVIQERKVSSARVRAGVTILRVEGEWKYMPEPGVLLCSGALLENDQKFANELKMAVKSPTRLTGERETTVAIATGRNNSPVAFVSVIQRFGEAECRGQPLLNFSPNRVKVKEHPMQFISQNFQSDLSQYLPTDLPGRREDQTLILRLQRRRNYR